MQPSKELKKHLDMEWIEDMFIYAMRYTIGRSSYSPGVCMDFLTPLIPHMSMKTLVVMARDLKEHLDYDLCREYKDHYADDWRKFKALIDEEIKKR